MALESNKASESTNVTLELLQIRLRRLEFLLTGRSAFDGLPSATAKSPSSAETVLSRLDAIQGGLNKLRRGGDVVGEMVADIESIRTLPDLYASSTDSGTDNKYPELRNDASSDSIQDHSTRASIVLANATLYPETASRLASLQTLQIPTAESSSKLSILKTDIETCLRDQDQIDDEVQNLRLRSGRCLEWWVKTGVVGMGDLWEEWEYGLKDLERQVARFEMRQKEHQGYI